MKSYKISLYSAGRKVKSFLTDHVYYSGGNAEFKVKNLEIVVSGTFVVEQVS